jgi:hypothetical protein
MPPTCSICKLKNVGEINSQIAQGVPFRNIAQQIKPTHYSVYRHAINCLTMDVQQFMREGRLPSVINVREEFAEQLAFAKKLRVAAQDYLSDPADPLKVILLPRADEIEVVYYDNNDVTEGENPKPKKKRTDLQTLLYMLQGPDDLADDWAKEAAAEKILDEGDPDKVFRKTWEAAKKYFLRERQSIDREADKVTIKHVDLRSFAIKSLEAADMALNRFAMMEGAYTDNRPNPKAAAIKVLETIQRSERVGLQGAIEWLLKEQKERQEELFPQQLLLEIGRENGIIEIGGLQ